MENKSNPQENVPEKKDPKEQPKMRQIIIETDGNSVGFVKTEVAGTLELKSVLQELLNKMKTQ